MAERGRKCAWEELELIKRYSELSDDYFRVLKEMFVSEEKADKKWAAERLEKPLVKMIPQDITSGGETIVIKIAQDISEKYED